METIVLGKIGQNIFENEMLKRGWDLYTPLLENTKIDCIAIKNCVSILRFQIKLVGNDNKIPVRKISHNQGQYKIHHYTSNEIDYFVGVDRNTNDLYIIPISVIEKYKSCISITKLQEYKNNFIQLEPNIGNNISGQDDNVESFISNNGNDVGMNVNTDDHSAARE